MFKYEEIVLERVSAGRAARCRPCGCPPHRQPPLTPKHSPELMGTGGSPLPSLEGFGGVWLSFPRSRGLGSPLPPRTPPEGREEGFSLTSLFRTLAPAAPPAQSWGWGGLFVTVFAGKWRQKELHSRTRGGVSVSRLSPGCRPPAPVAGSASPQGTEPGDAEQQGQVFS